MAVNANYDKMALGLHFYGANNGTVFTDSSLSSNSATVYGNAKTSTAINDPFGASAGVGYFDGNGDYLTIPDSAGWDLPADFTIRFRVYLAGYSAAFGGSYGACIIANYKSPTGNLGWQVRINGTASSYTTLNLYTGNTDLNFSHTFALNTWYDVEVTRASGTIRAFVDGTQIGASTANTDTFTKTNSDLLYIGRLNDATYIFYLNGYLADLEIYKGVALHTSNFTPSSSAFMGYMGQLTGNVTEGGYSYISKWLVKGWRSFSDTVSKEQVVTGTTYTVDLPTLDPYVLACAPYIDGKWEADKVVTLGQFYVASNPETSAHLWEVTTAGTFDSTEASWNLSGTTTQGTATMTYVGALPNGSILGPKIPS